MTTIIDIIALAGVIQPACTEGLEFDIDSRHDSQFGFFFHPDRDLTDAEKLAILDHFCQVVNTKISTHVSAYLDDDQLPVLEFNPLR